MGKKELELLNYLKQKVFNPILTSDSASFKLKQGVRHTVNTMRKLDAKGMLSYYWSSIIGSSKSRSFAKLMKEEGFTRFEEVVDEMRVKFDDKWYRN
jgi:hypothetical protein